MNSLRGYDSPASIVVERAPGQGLPRLATGFCPRMQLGGQLASMSMQPRTRVSLLSLCTVQQVRSASIVVERAPGQDLPYLTTSG